MVRVSRVGVALSILSLAMFGIFAVMRSNTINETERSPVTRNLRDKRLVVGLADDRPVGERVEEIGADFQNVVKYQDVRSLDYRWMVKPYLDKGKSVTMVIEFFSDDYRNLEKIANGEYDDHLYSFIGDIKADGNRKFSIRPLHEFNGDWYPWGTYRGNENNTGSFKRAFRHIAEIFRRKGANVDIQLDYNCENARGDNKSFRDWWPGDDVVDMVMCNAYNRYGLSKWHNDWESFRDVFQAGYDEMLKLPGNKPLGIGETGTTGYGYKKAQWFKDAFKDLAERFVRVEECDFFLINKGERNWGLNSWDEEKAFGESLQKYNWLENL